MKPWLTLAAVFLGLTIALLSQSALAEPQGDFGAACTPKGYQQGYCLDRIEERTCKDLVVRHPGIPTCRPYQVCCAKRRSALPPRDAGRQPYGRQPYGKPSFRPPQGARRLPERRPSSNYGKQPARGKNGKFVSKGPSRGRNGKFVSKGPARGRNGKFVSKGPARGRNGKFVKKQPNRGRYGRFVKKQANRGRNGRFQKQNARGKNGRFVKKGGKGKYRGKGKRGKGNRRKPQRKPKHRNNVLKKKEATALDMKSTKNIAVAKRTCKPQAKGYFDGNCIKNSMRNSCKHNAAIVQGTGCNADESCCAPKTNQKPEVVKSSVCTPRDPRLSMGKCESAARCKNDKKIVTPGSGCQKGLSCCTSSHKMPDRGVCRPSKTSEFLETGSCMPDAKRSTCSKDRAPAQGVGCNKGHFCCAEKKPAKGQCALPVGYKDGHCMSTSLAARDCKGQLKEIVRGAQGCAKSQVCCALKTNEKCDKDPESIVGKHSYSFSVKVPPPFVALSKTRLQVWPPGVKIYFVVKVGLTIKADVTCVRCGKSTVHPMTNNFEMDYDFPYTLKGAKLLARLGTAWIPGVNFALMAWDIAKTVKEMWELKDKVMKLYNNWKNSSGKGVLFRCTKNGIDQSKTNAATQKLSDKKRAISDVADLLEAAEVSTDENGDVVYKLPREELDLGDRAVLDVSEIMTQFDFPEEVTTFTNFSITPLEPVENQVGN